jgi:hypothetical protein
VNKRQKKKAFKKRFGVNPPKGIKPHDAIILYENKDAILLAAERIKTIILDAWAQIKGTFQRFYEELSKALREVEEKNRQQGETFKDTNAIEQLRQRAQEREAMKIESYINILNHDRR